MKNRDSISGTLMIAAILCVVCAVLVSVVAVSVRPLQASNKLLDRNTNILLAAGIYDPSKNKPEEVNALFASFESVIIELKTGKILSQKELDNLSFDIETFDALKLLEDKNLSTALTNADDLAQIKQRENYALVYLLKNDSGVIERIVLPVRGYGLWGTLYGYLALEGNANTVIRLAFYDHKETPGLGDAIEESRSDWITKFAQKSLTNPDKKGWAVKRDGGEFDQFTGATITPRAIVKAVYNTLRYYKEHRDTLYE